MTAHEALSHPFVSEEPSNKETDLLPVVKKNFNARRTLHAAIDTIRAINMLREGGAMMSGARSADPKRQEKPAVAIPDGFPKVGAEMSTDQGETDGNAKMQT